MIIYRHKTKNGLQNNNIAKQVFQVEDIENNAIVKLEPVFKDYIWGGTKLKDIYHKKSDYDVLAESWELAVHKDGQCVVADGRYKGMLFGDYLKLLGSSCLGENGCILKRFPILIKFIDAQKPLSIQVHPDDEYAYRVEKNSGKIEMWYIVDCDDGASIYCGVKQNITRTDFIERINNNTVLDILKKITVHKGDVFWINAGTIHAIGEGILACEIQQNSNCTYRIYDYNRCDQYGNKRILHLHHAQVVSNLSCNNLNVKNYYEDVIMKNGYTIRQLGKCKYFKCILYTIFARMILRVSDQSFISIIIIEGEGVIIGQDKKISFVAADSFFVPAGEQEIEISGKCTVICTSI